MLMSLIHAIAILMAGSDLVLACTFVRQMLSRKKYPKTFEHCVCWLKR